MVKSLPANAGDTKDVGLIPELGGSPGGGHGNPLQYYCLGMPWTEESGGLWSIGSQRVRHDRSYLACIVITVAASAMEMIPVYDPLQALVLHPH